MASLVLGAVGAAIGSTIPGTLLGMSFTSIGWSLGSTLGSMLFKPKGQEITQEGSRLGDLKVQSSTYGNPLPIFYGSMRAAGNVIWSTDIVETRHTSTQSSGGGKGGGGGGSKVTTVTYTYSQSFAVAIGEGPITGVRKIWANGKLIYNLSDSASLATIAASTSAVRGIRIYTGSESQTADSLIQANVGAANAPAYRGVAYVVFDNLQLADYGNRMPNVEFEVIVSGSAAEVATSYLSLPDAKDWVASAFGNGMLLVLNQGYPTYTVTALRSYDSGANWSPILTNLSYAVYHCIFAAGLFYAGTSNGIWRSGDGITWAQVKTGVTATALAYGDGVIYATDYGTTNLWVSEDGEDWAQQTISAVARNWYGVAVGNGTAVVTAGGATAAARVGASWVDVSIAALSGFLRIAYGNGLFVAAGSNGMAYSSDGQSWSAGAAVPASAPHGAAFGGGSFAFAAGQSVYLTTDGVTVVSHTEAGKDFYGLAYGNGIFTTVSISSTYALAFLPAPVISSVASQQCSAIVSDICQRAGLTAGQIDVSALTDDVHGYVVQRSTARAQIEQLMRAFYFDAVESGGKVKFVKRGASPAITIAEDDLAAHEYGSEPPDTALVTRTQEMELPLETDIQYLDTGAAYQVGAQYSQRLTTESENKVSLNFAIAMSATKAKQIADVLMYDAWTGRTQFDFQTAWKHSYLEPTDVIDIVKAGRTYTVRLADEDASLVSRRRAVLEDPSIYSQSGAAAEILAPDEEVALVPLTKLVLMDIPLLRDQDDGVGFYAAACGYGAGWYGAQAYKSADGGATWGSFGGGFLNDAAIGTATGVLGSFSQNIFDEANSVTVVLINGELASDTEANVLNGANAALLGDEIIQFKTATLIADSTYTLSGLLRGRRGTEWAAGTHAAGERFVLLDATSTYLFEGASSEYDLERHYRGATFGGFLDEAETVAFTHTAVAQTPLAPVLLGGGRNASDDITLNWTRRTRIGGGWNSYSDVPLGEATESYEIEIWDGSGYATLKRTLAAATPTVSYTAAQQTTDFGAPQSTVYCRVYQLSAQVGRGYKLEGSI